jgi:hypothetical protein
MYYMCIYIYIIYIYIKYIYINHIYIWLVDVARTFGSFSNDIYVVWFDAHICVGSVYLDTYWYPN